MQEMDEVPSKSAFWRVPTAMVLFSSVLMILVLLARSLIGYGNPWIKELALFSNAIFVIFGMFYLFRSNGHIGVDIFLKRLPKNKQALLMFLGDLFFTLPLSFLILWYSVPFFIFSWKINESSPDVGGVPALFIFKSLLPLFAMLFFFQVLIRVYSYLRGHFGYRKNSSY